MPRIVRLVGCVGIVWLASIPRASADPIVVTAGFLTAPRLTPPNGTASLTGTRGFTLEARVTTGEGNVEAVNECTPCLPGTELSVGGVLSGTVFVGTATLDGNTYADLLGVDAPASLYFEFFGSTITPAFRNAPTTITAPFTMRGQFNLPFPTPLAFFEGRGIATVLLTPELDQFGEHRWVGDFVRYDFSDQTPVPEPATLVMVASGLLAVVRGRFRNRHSARPGPRRDRQIATGQTSALDVYCERPTALLC
jgi:hypothetical protein